MLVNFLIKVVLLPVRQKWRQYKQAGLGSAQPL